MPTLAAGRFPPLHPYIFPCRSTETAVGLPEGHDALPTEVPPPLTVVAVPHAVLEHSSPLLLFFARHQAEVIVPGVGVPEDEGEIRGALQDGGVPRFGGDACRGKDALKGRGIGTSDAAGVGGPSAGPHPHPRGL